MFKIVLFFFTLLVATDQCASFFSYNQTYKPIYDAMESLNTLQPILPITRYQLLKKMLFCIKKKIWHTENVGSTQKYSMKKELNNLLKNPIVYPISNGTLSML